MRRISCLPLGALVDGCPMTTIQIRSLTADSIRAAESRRLLAWALEHGGDELTIEVMALQGVEASLADAFEDALAPWSIAPARRTTLSGASREELRREVRLWRLTPLSATLLSEFLPEGLFSYDVQERGWFENPIVYRRGVFLFGALTHEREGYAQVSTEEAEDLLRAGVPVGPALAGIQLEAPGAP